VEIWYTGIDLYLEDYRRDSTLDLTVSARSNLDFHTSLLPSLENLFHKSVKVRICPYGDCKGGQDFLP